MRNATILLILALVPLGAADAQDPAPNADRFVGTWTGDLEVPGAGLTLRLRFDLTRADTAQADAGLAATLHSIDQGNAEIPVESVEWSDSRLSMSMPSVGASFEGELSEDGDAIEGTFTQMGAAMPLLLRRTSEEEADAATRRPQDPEEPFPYHVEEVAYPNPSEGHVLAGTFTAPAEGGPFPAVVLISGSGPQDRDEALLGHRPFLVLSDHLTKRGIAVLRFDDRGVGESTGDFATATSRDFTTDALAGVAYLKSREDVDPSRIGLAGHSEGGLIAPMAAAESGDVAYIVLLAGPGVNGERILHAQGALIAQANGASEEEIAGVREMQAAIFAVLKETPDADEAGAKIEEMVRTRLEEASEEERAAAGVTDEASARRVAAAQGQQMNSPWFRYFLTHEPADFLERVTVPVLAVGGEKDLQVPSEENLREIEAALKRGGNSNYEIHLLPGHNHLFQHAETGAPSEYQSIEETWSVESMELVANWILRTAGGLPDSPASDNVFHHGDSLAWEDYGPDMQVSSLYGDPSVAGESVIQVHGVGPFTTDFVNPR